MKSGKAAPILTNALTFTKKYEKGKSSAEIRKNPLFRQFKDNENCEKKYR